MEENTKKYYLISYSYREPNRDLQNAMEVTDQNPFDWILEVVQNDYRRNQQERKHFENYVLLNFWELTKEQFEKMDGVIG